MLTILGKGQLGLMIREAADHLRVPHEWIDAPHQISRTAECVTVESEFLDPEALRAAMPAQARFAPGFRALATLQDKWDQKELFQRLGIPTSPFSEVQTLSDVRSACVLKWSRLGYDGKGVLKTEPGDPRISEFLATGKANGGRVYAEEIVPFEFEIATVATRSPSGVIHFAPVRTVQAHGICSEVYTLSSPLPPPWLRTAREAMEKLGQDQDILGTFALEWFLVGDRLLANECAPRVHNSGHVTLASGSLSQFEAHVRACMGLNLPSPELRYPFSAMLNLIGPPGAPRRNPVGPTVEGPGLTLKWYNKAELRPGRKMGHLNVVAERSTDFEIRLRAARRIVERWAAG